MSLSKEIWDSLSKLDVSKYTEKKGRFTYLSWAWAWAEFSKLYPDCEYELSDRLFPDGTMEVYCKMEVFAVGGERPVKRNMWLPVLNNSNKAIANPDAFDINTAKMRCLVKCLAMYGLGHYIYAGEDLPFDEDNNRQQEKPKAQPKQTQDDDNKPWFNDEDLDGMREGMIAKIQSGDRTPQEIIKNLRNTFKLSKKMAQEIEELV